MKNRILNLAAIFLLIFQCVCFSQITIKSLTMSNVNFGKIVQGTITITSPVQYQLFQRTGTTSNISISGTYTGNPSSIEASFNGGAYASISSSPTGGAFSGTLTSQNQGQGTLTVRFANNTAISALKTFIGIGDIFLCAGQSNMVGQGTSNQSYSSTDGFKASLFGNDYAWKELKDPYDKSTGQIDTVSSDNALGSTMVLLATEIMNSAHVPVALIPTAANGTGIDQWQPSSNHQDRTTLYGSMNYRANQMLNGVKAVLWWQGEHEMHSGNSQAYYNAFLETLANAINSDMGVKIVPCKLQHLGAASGVTQAQQDAINAAIAQGWGDNSHIAGGVDLTGINTDSSDGFHLNATAKLQAAADAWFSGLNSAGLL